MPRILLTGAGGFIGRHVATAFDGQAEVLPARLASGRRADLLDADDRARLLAETKPEILVHLAWVTEHGKFWSSPLNAAWEEASADLFARFYAQGGRRALGSGSCAEYDWTTGAECFAEDAPLAPHTEYGAAKVRTAEALSREARGASWAWVRVFFSFGAGEPPGRLVPLMLRAARSRTPLGIGPADTVRDFWPVETLGAAIAAVVLSDVEGPVNTASGVGTRFDALAEMVEAAAGVSDIIATDQRPLGPGEPPMLVADAHRLRAQVGFAGTEPLAAALRRYLDALGDGT